MPPSNSCCPQSETLLWHYHFPCPWAHRNAELPCVLDRVEKVNPGWWDVFFFFWSFKDYQLLLNHDARIHLLINLQDFMWIIHDSWRSWNDVQTWKKGVPRRWEHHHQPWHFYGLPISPRNPRCDERPHQHLRCLRLASTNICWRKKIFIVFIFSKLIHRNEDWELCFS